MKKNLLVISLFPVLLCSCGQPASSSSASTAPSGQSSSSQPAQSSSEPALGYKTKKINVYYPKSQFNTTCDIRYYGTSVIPYVSLKDYHKLLYRGRTFPQGRDRFDLAKNGDVYTATVAGDYTATFDIKTNKIESADLWNFKSTNLNGVGDIFAVSYDGLPFTKPKTVTFDKGPSATSIDLSKYGMTIHGDENGVYLPLAFASDLFTSENILQGAYNGKDLYITNFTENESLSSFGGQYYDQIFANPINQEYATYAYNEMCLDYDLFLGRPGRSSLEAYYDLSKGLDSALQSRPLGQTIKRYMKSTDLGEFLAGSTMLGLLREDGGHSGYTPLYVGYVDEKTQQLVSPKWMTKEVYDKAEALIQEEVGKQYEELINQDRSFSEAEAVASARETKLGKPNRPLNGTETYTKDGDVAYIHIDGFMDEIGLQNEWNKYYQGQRDTIPFGEGVGGSVGAITHGLEEAAKDTEIKHVVIDLAVNSGGSADEMMFLVALLTGSHDMYTHNLFSHRHEVATYEFDFNFDKKFDAEDEEYRVSLLQGKDISVLTTKNGFSCGGISPVYLHDEGLFTIGEECGGGSCSVYMQYDAYGNSNRASSPDVSTTKTKVSIDVARKTVCDAKLNFPASGGARDYSALYDTANLRTLINTHYKK